MSEQLDRFINLMKGIFEIDKSDLDFGIYRIMNIRKREIEAFLTEGLPKRVRETLAPFADNSDAVRAEMAELKKKCDDLGMEIENVPKLYAQYTALQKKLAQGTDLSALETDVYSALFSFFNRYYDEGDFISKRRYKEGVYAIPYEGEEVKLYWANQDQYYIKTSENFKDYTFKADDYTVHFRLVDATTEQNNNKEAKDAKRVFMLFQGSEEYPDLKTFEYDTESKELIVRFVYDIPEDKKAQKVYDELNYNAITEYLIKEHKEKISVLLAVVSSDKKKQTTLMQKHLNAYVAKNTFDYFIHKDLGGFLRRELDFYIKNEIMHLDDLDTDSERSVETYLAKIKAVKRVGNVIIDFLAQIENFQKKLWLKKKFVVETDWCMTLDKVDERFYPEIIANPEQVQEWIEMYAVDEIEGDLTHCAFTDPPSIEFLRENQNLLIDTKHFSDDFKSRLVASIDDLDEQTNGVMIKSDNWQALNLIHMKYHEKVSSVLIDPPYNTGEDDFIYKDGYSSSSWLTMINERVEIGMEMLSQKGVMQICTGDEEQEYLASYLRNRYGKESLFANLVWEKKKKGSFLSGKIARMKDYVVCIAKSPELFEGLIGEVTTEIETYPCVNASNPRDVRTVSHIINSKFKHKNYKLEAGNIISAGNMNLKLLSDLIIQDGKLVPPLKVEGNWRYSQESMDEYARSGDLYITQDLYLRRIVREPRLKRLKDLLLRVSDDTEVDYKKIDLNNLNRNGWGSNEDANDELLQILGKQYVVSYPKPIKLFAQLLHATKMGNGIYLDYFAGSGTTALAVITLNRIDQINRKFVIVDSGYYFDTVTIERIKKYIYSSDWENGKPQNRDTGVSQIIKYMRLESYEDALSNIEFNSEETGLLSLFGDDYLIRYMLDLETEGSLLNIAAFSNPFDYKMKITEKNESRLRKVDLCETFNYLIGLSVIRQSSVAYFKTVKDADGEYDGAVRLVPDRSGKYAFMQIEGTLPNGDRALVIWRIVTSDTVESNAALDAYFLKHRINPLDREYDVIFVNGDNNLENLRTDKEIWKVVMTETEFKRRMFEETE